MQAAEGKPVPVKDLPRVRIQTKQGRQNKHSMESGWKRYKILLLKRNLKSKRPLRKWSFFYEKLLHNTLY